ncbi:hypothetical protein [Streptomyces sp. WAC01280]|uniref:hypothetical protein n=1 Tax=Streptomyces sp. WAC01280 TaxID=2487424 RepID=UPI000F7ABF58|nr:hypothetical protein [Streptomyces sp. WAC01280]RSS50260.1 hypothetical protein EF909_38545 [Streptomyces sp. WAC01280]
MSNDQQYDPYANGQQGHGQQGPDVTQTWEGQTWDTQFQPVVQQQPPVTYEAPYQDPYAQPAYEPAYEPSYDNTAYLPPQGAVAYEQHPHPTQQQHQQQPYAAAPAAPAAPVGYDTPVPAYTPEPVAEAASAAPAAPAGYSSPTTSGNTRITDAQRARAEGRSPVIEPGLQPAALTAVLGLLLAGGAALGPYGLLVPLVLLQGLTAAGWFRLNGMWPARQGIALAFAGGLVADAALLATGREHAAAAILGTLGAWVLLCLVLQLRSHADPDERMYGLMAGVASAALTVVAAGHLGAAPDAVVVGGIAVAATVVARALPLPGPVSLIVALLAGAGAGIAAGGLNDLGGSGALIGLAAGVCALVGLRVASYDYPSRFVHMTAGVALPLTAAAPAVYLLGRALA